MHENIHEPARITLFALGILGLVNLVRGGIHLFAADGGSVIIAGLDISGAPEIILFLFAAQGTTQIGFGALNLFAVFKRRSFVLPLLAVQTGQFWVMLWVWFLFKPLPVNVPGKWGNIVNAVLFSVVLVYEVLRKPKPRSTHNI